MADEQYKWLTRETAERLLRGESLEAVDISGRDQAEQLGKALGALAAEAAPAAGELPGEQAALAAFRKAREAAEAERDAAALADGTPRGRSRRTSRALDESLVRIGAATRTGIRSRRPSWARPVRLALAAAVAAGTLGGVAVAAGSGVLRLPFHEEPGPAASVSAQNSSEPLISPSPQSTPGADPDRGTPSAGAGGSAGADPSRDAAGQGRGKNKGKGKGKDKGAEPGSADPSGIPGTWWKVAVTACRDIRDGKELGNDRRRVLEGLAGGSARVTTYCKSVLDADRSASGGQGEGGDGDGDKGGGNGKGDGKDKGEGNGQGGDDDGHHDDGHHGGRHRTAVPPVPAAPTTFGPLTPARQQATFPAPAPSPTYTAL
ncbi:hypothetical protein J2Z21_002376 [Streptomyces griseochromogenes]|uniref:Extensin n=1 Tax=Streptomyces griseochromogenes TaxID=68214 RepID=A0A1B1AR28_9ACTN|nr:hypothetical protein [Streptomyces griseochromogenes]ANP49038.1 hypothetical protein AVL59_05105 [Streptomyces griseochromogenes]MBP2049445.1 hypothetical protein [Streptomyces griseochromogenes]